MVKWALVFSFALCLSVIGSESKRFPVWEMIDVNKKPFVIPSDLKGKPSILYMGFSREGGERVNQWLDRALDRVPTQSVNHVNVVVGDVPFFVERFIINGIKEGPYYPRGVKVGLYFNDAEDILLSYPIRPTGDVSIMVLSPVGDVVYQTGGVVTTQNMEQLMMALKAVNKKEGE